MMKDDAYLVSCRAADDLMTELGLVLLGCSVVELIAVHQSIISEVGLAKEGLKGKFNVPCHRR